MSELEQRLETDLTASMRARDELRTATLRMMLAAVRNERVAGKQARDLTDDEALRVVGREAKKRREAADAYTQGGRPDRAERELAELGVIEGYLPAQLSDDELTALVSAAVAEAGAASPQQMGAVMKLVTPRVAGRAEGARVAAEVRRQLGA